MNEFLDGLTFNYKMTSNITKYSRNEVAKVKYNKEKEKIEIHWANYLTYSDFKNVMYNIKEHDIKKFNSLKNKNPEYFL